MMPHGITELQLGFWFALHVMPCIPTLPVYCMFMYDVQISHTSLVFVSECNTQLTLLFGLCFSRWLYNNRLTELPDGLLSATTQLFEL